MPRPVRLSALLVALLAVTGAVGADAQQQPQRPAISGAVVISEIRAVRVPLRPMTVLPVPVPVPQWKESRGPRCIDRDAIAGATRNDPGSVDFILRDGSRHRAQLQNSCPALDYYPGFYLKPTADGKICRDRDSVHARSGGECQIDRFRKLSPAKPPRWWRSP